MLAFSPRLCQSFLHQPDRLAPLVGKQIHAPLYETVQGIHVTVDIVGFRFVHDLAKRPLE